METKKDWVVDEIVKPDDFNRIETNIEELDNRVNEIETPDFKEGDKTGTSFEPLHAKEKFPFLLEKISSWYYAIKIKSKELVDKITEIEKQHETNVNEINTDIANLENRKADKTQIPTSLPANGGNADTLGGRVASDLSVNYANSAGNADTVDNLHAVDFVQNKRRSISAEELNNPNYTNSYFAETENGSQIGLGANWYHILYFSHVNKDGFGAQIAIPLHYDKEVYYRNSEGVNWSAWKRFITSDNINSQNVNYASSAYSASRAEYAVRAGTCDNATTLEGRTAAQILLQGGKHLAGQGDGGGYSFLGDYAEDTGMFSDADGELHFKQNGVKWYAAHADHNHDNTYSKATQVRKGNGTASTIEGGSSNTADGYCAHAEGDQAAAGGYCSHVEGGKTSANSSYSHVEGYMNVANGVNAHAEGRETAANESSSHTEGYATKTNGYAAHAEGYETTADGHSAHTSGRWTFAGGSQSAAFGTGTQAKGWCSFTIGKYNIDPSSENVFHSPFIIGRGADDANRANAFRVYGTGQVYAQGAYNTGGADYAEYFEWLDGNEESQDRVGYFVTLNKDKIKIANSDDYILGIISAAPSIIGNSYDDQWCDMYLKDEWGRVIYEEVELPEELDEEGNIIIEARKEMQPKLNPVYNNSKKYVGRSQRKEWSAVGMLGQLLVRDDGTCQVDGYCKCGDGGIATAAEAGYRVLARVSDNIIRILFR